MTTYTAKIREASRELTAKEKIQIKDTGNATSIDALTTEQGSFVIDYAFHVLLDIHNEQSTNPDYSKVVVVDKDGQKFTTGSESFIRNLTDIVNEMTEAGEGDNIQIECFRKESKNYKGKSFIGCALV